MKLDLDYLKENLPLSFEYFDSIDSTSLYLKRRIKDGLSVPDVVIAGVQTNGQGRVGRSFYSPEETGLYLTFCFSSDAISCEDITPRIALSVLRSIEEIFHLSLGVKWVNDIYLGGKKVSGVLCQRVDDYYLIGVGINVEAPKSIPEELKNRFGSLCDTCDPSCYGKLVLSLYQNINKVFCEDKQSILDTFRDRCIHIGKPVSIEYNNEILRGICSGISDDFSLLLDNDGETKNITSGFMSLKI